MTPEAWKEIQGMLEKQKATTGGYVPSTTTGDNFYAPKHVIPYGVCPHCGYCPHCGRGGWHPPYVTC